MSSPIPPGASLRDRTVAARQLSVARRLGLLAIALVLAVLISVAFRLRQTEPRETRSDSAVTTPARPIQP